ncbi:MAG: hypothetical protein AAFV01_07685, partial [Bacteroidota bacterium]
MQRSPVRHCLSSFMEPVLTSRPPHVRAFWKPNVSHREPPPTYAAEVRALPDRSAPPLWDTLQ